MFDASDSEGLEVRWEGPGISKELIPTSQLYRVGIYGDFTGDDIVDMNDLDDFLEFWLVDDCNETAGLDLDGNCRINFHEFSALAQNWGGE
jgi:hypothetical protein